ncbi:MAG: hypothetical protein ACFFCS_12260 [Candidatus Hodarchaeota archaeon]
MSISFTEIGRKMLNILSAEVEKLESSLNRSLYRENLYTKFSPTRLQEEIIEPPVEFIEKGYFIAQAMENLNVINVVALGLVHSCETIDFESFIRYAKKVDLEVKMMNRFPSLNITVLGVTVLLFKNGKIIFTGEKDVSKLRVVSTEFERILNESMNMGDSIEIELIIQNMVAMTRCHHFIDLEDMCLNCCDIIYEPEQFPAAILKRNGKRGVFLIFSNSKIICLGLKSREDIDREMEAFLDVLYPFARTPI